MKARARTIPLTCGKAALRKAMWDRAPVADFYNVHGFLFYDGLRLYRMTLLLAGILLFLVFGAGLSDVPSHLRRYATFFQKFSYKYHKND
jgi:hypothetical protein